MWLEMLELGALLCVLSGLVASESKDGDMKMPSKNDALAEIEALHQKDMQASEAGDFDTLISLAADEAILLPPGMPPIIGKEAIWQFMQDQKEELYDYVITEYIHDWKEIKIIDDWAYEWAVYSNAAQPKGGGQIVRQQGKLFRILKRQEDGSWKIARAIWNADP